MEFILLKIDSEAWTEIWTWLENHPINEGIENPSLALNDTQGWQYTGSLKQGERVISSFRHRNHPKTGGIKTLDYAHQVNPDSIERSFKV
jgi:hypothetical protein